ncbi:uncharacterized protein LOC132745978 [Ruditapes philippinarum]|uniref:uncharacterized protein LOC132745978 n=1 Tax=Ruditapes philippinarum TaxID=129788 RepID=UPI00295B6B2F|nr:uncharacterized protein LOC132745978 [Ruditapes philippinarum]
MHNPNLQDPLSPYFGSDDEENFEDNVKKYMAGVEFDDMTFDKDFIVIDGILIEDTVASARAEVQNGVDVPRTTIDYPEGPKIINDVISIADLKISDNDGHSTDEIVNKTSLNDANIPKIELIKAQHIEDNEEMIKDLNTETIKGVTDCQGTGDTVSDDNAEDDYESNDFDIQLVNVDGDCLLIHRGKTNADEINDETNEQDTDNMSEAIQNELPPENNEEGEVNSQIEVSNPNTNEMKNKVCANAACNFTASDYTCDIEDENVGSYSQENKNDTKTLISDTHVETNVQFKDNPSHDSYINIGTWYTIMTVLSKIVLKRNRYKL